MHSAGQIALAGLVLGLVLCVSAQTAISNYTINLRSGSGSPANLPAGSPFSWYENLNAGSGNCVCDRQGVLKITFNPATRKRAVIQMTFEESRGWTFNLGDSATNNGYAGDASTQKNDAEMHSIDDRLFFWGRDKQPGESYGQLHLEPNMVGAKPYTTLTLDVQDEKVRADNGFRVVVVDSWKFFQLNSQPDSDPGGVNNDLYLGLNRVISWPGSRVGSGLCKVTITFYNV